VPFDAGVHDLRLSWFQEDFPGLDPGDYFEQAAGVAAQLGAKVLAVKRNGAPVAYAQVDRVGRAAEVAQVYVSPEYRGAGLGTALTRAAIEAAADADELWIVADDAGRPKELYGRLGFRPAWTAMQALLPG
jgi:putative acetyltransferase